MKLKQLLPAILLVALAGCPYRPIKVNPAPEPPAPANVSAVERAAMKFDADFIEAWAVEAEETARKARAGEFKTWEDAAADWEIRNKAAFNRVVPELSKPVNDAFGPDDSAFDGKKLAEVMEEVAKGHRSFKGK